MSGQTATVVGIAAVILAPLLSYLGVLWRFSGSVDTSEAGRLWEAYKVLVEEYRARVGDLELRVGQLEGLNRDLLTLNRDLLNDKAKLEGKVLELKIAAGGL